MPSVVSLLTGVPSSCPQSCWTQEPEEESDRGAGVGYGRRQAGPGRKGRLGHRNKARCPGRELECVGPLQGQRGINLDKVGTFGPEVTQLRSADRVFRALSPRKKKRIKFTVMMAALPPRPTRALR